MIWNPFKKTQEAVEEIPVPGFIKLRFKDTDGKLYEFKPAKTIPAYEVALLLPMFATITYSGIDRFAYIRENKLEKHFKLIKKEE
jgi:hypothetical protein